MIFFTHKHDIPKQGGGGVPDLGEIPTFSRFFLLTSICILLKKSISIFLRSWHKVYIYDFHNSKSTKTYMLNIKCMKI